MSVISRGLGIWPGSYIPPTAPASIEENIIFGGPFASDYAGTWMAIADTFPYMLTVDNPNFPPSNLQNADLTIPLVTNTAPTYTAPIAIRLDLGVAKSLVHFALLGHNLYNLSQGLLSAVLSWGSSTYTDYSVDITNLVTSDNYGICGKRGRPIYVNLAPAGIPINARYVQLALTGGVAAIPGGDPTVIIGRMIVAASGDIYQMQRQFDLGSEFSELVIGQEVQLDNIHTVANPQVAAAGTLEFIAASEQDRNSLSAIHARSLTTNPVLIVCHPERIPAIPTVYFGGVGPAITDYIGNKEAYYAWFDDKQVKWTPTETLSTYKTSIKFHTPYLPR